MNGVCSAAERRTNNTPDDRVWKNREDAGPCAPQARENEGQSGYPYRKTVVQPLREDSDKLPASKAADPPPPPPVKRKCPGGECDGSGFVRDATQGWPMKKRACMACLLTKRERERETFVMRTSDQFPTTKADVIQYICDCHLVIRTRDEYIETLDTQLAETSKLAGARETGIVRLLEIQKRYAEKVTGLQAEIAANRKVARELLRAIIGEGGGDG